MNFLLHHHLAERDLGRAQAAAGSMLPDVWRMADRRARLRDAEVAPHADLRSVSDGLAHHLAVDAWFHRAPVFLHGETAARAVLRRARDAPKLGLFAHVAWELCLDGALLRRLGVERVLRDVRASVAAVRPDVHHRVAAVRVRLPAADRAVFEARVDRILDAIGAGPWVAGYATAPGVVERLDGLRARLGFPPMSPGDRDAVAAGLERLAPEADAAFDAITDREGHGPSAALLLPSPP
jgi:hypothetical protein